MVLASVAFILAAVVVTSGCGSSDAVRPASTQSAGVHALKGAGATFPALLYKNWFEAYTKAHPESHITFDSTGSGDGVRRFIGKGATPEEKVDFGASDAALTDSEIQQVSGGALMLPVTAGSIVLSYNIPEISGELRLSRDAYAGIFLGEIKSWDDPAIAASNPGKALPKYPICVVVRQDGSGTTFGFTTHLNAISTKWHDKFGAHKSIAWPNAPTERKGNEGVAGAIKMTAGSIGYVEFAYAKKAELPMASLENRAGRYVAPTEESCASTLAKIDLPENLRAFMPDPEGSESYPIVSLTWILLYRKYDNVEKTTDLQQLFRWCLTEGQKSSSALGYIPLPQNVSRKAYEALDSLK